VLNPERASLEARQTERLRALLEAVQSNRFYAPRLPAPVSSLAEFAARVPFTCKEDFAADQKAHPPYGTNLTYPLGNYTRFCQTSSTTGSPLRWLDTAESWDWMVRCWIRVLRAAGAQPGDRVFFAFSFGPFLGFWVAFDAATRMGCLAIPGGGMNSTARLHVLRGNRANILCCTPTYAVRLAEVAAAESIELAGLGLHTVIVAGEPGGSVPGTRALLERLWPGARIFDHHGMTETGPVSYECPRRPGVLHVMESEFVAEIVDPDSGQPLPPGSAGELVLTNLGRAASPAIRYRTGDLVQPAVPGQPCECGSVELALEGGILARRDDMVVIRGVNVYPSAVEDILRGCGGIAEYRVEIAAVRSMVELRLKVEPESGVRHEDLAHRLETALRDAFGLRIPAEIVPSGSLPRFEMKAKRWIRI
jgi:phenylacetate-CoA ligase